MAGYVCSGIMCLSCHTFLAGIFPESFLPPGCPTSYFLPMPYAIIFIIDISIQLEDNLFTN